MKYNFFEWRGRAFSCDVLAERDGTAQNSFLHGRRGEFKKLPSRAFIAETSLLSSPLVIIIFFE